MCVEKSGMYCVIKFDMIVMISMVHLTKAA